MTERQRQYLADHQDKLDALQRMWRDPRVQLYNDDKLPNGQELKQIDSIFLAGPTSRNQILEYNWRCEAVTLLRTYGFHGWIYCPEPRGQEIEGDYTERSYIYQWESVRLLSATHVAFWVPRNSGELLGLNTNFEWAFFMGMKFAHSELHQTPFDKPKGRFARQQVHVGWPQSAERMGLPHHYTEMANVQRHSSLLDLCVAIAEAPRSSLRSKL